MLLSRSTETFPDFLSKRRGGGGRGCCPGEEDSGPVSERKELESHNGRIRE